MAQKRRSRGSVPSAHAERPAGSIMLTAVPIVSQDDSIAAIRRRLHSRAFDHVDVVLLIDDRGEYFGAVDIRDILAAGGEALARDLVRSNWPSVHPGLSQEHAAEVAVAAGVSSLPVVSEEGRPLGCIPPINLLAVLGREHRDDMHRLVGMLRERDGARHALEDPPLKRVGQRLPWLLAGLVLSAGGAALMAGYEHLLTANIATAFFIPSLVYLTDAIGTQTEAVAVRALALRRKWPVARVLAGEILTGGTIGLLLGLLAFLGVVAVFQDPWLGIGVGVSMAAAGTLASTIGLMLPWALARAGVDPAFGSGPVATIIQDTLTILVYFLVMTRLLGAD